MRLWQVLNAGHGLVANFSDTGEGVVVRGQQKKTFMYLNLTSKFGPHRQTSFFPEENLLMWVGGSRRHTPKQRLSRRLIECRTAAGHFGQRASRARTVQRFTDVALPPPPQPKHVMAGPGRSPLAPQGPSLQQHRVRRGYPSPPPPTHTRDRTQCIEWDGFAEGAHLKAVRRHMG